MADLKYPIISTEADQLQRFRDWFEAGIDGCRDDFERFEKAYRFAAGEQWTAEEKYILKHVEGRDALTFNFIHGLINLVLGVLIQNRIKVSPEPVEHQDQFLADILQEAMEFLDNQSGSEAEEDDCFENTVTTGRGFVDVDVLVDPERPTEIKFFESSVPVHEVILDPMGRRDDLNDHRFVARYKWLSRPDFKMYYPEHVGAIDDIFTGNFESEYVYDPDDKTSIYEDDDYPHGLNTMYYDNQKDLVRVIVMQYWQDYQRHYAENPQTGQVEEFDPKQLKALKMMFQMKFGRELEFYKVWDKKIMRTDFIGDKVLYEGESPLPYRGFSIVPCFGYKNKSHQKVTHFGVVDPVIDSQVNVNKKHSEILNLMKNQIKGIMAEEGAFVDLQQAKDTITDSNEITWLKDGAIAGNKVQDKGGVSVSPGLVQIFQMDADSIKKISGINTDLLADSDKDVPGVVIQLRQKQGMLLLERLFQNNKRMRAATARRKLAIISKYMPESQLQRILGANEDYQIQDGVITHARKGYVANLREVRDLEYNIVIAESPDNMSRQMFHLSTYMEMLSKGMPVDPKAVIEKMDLSATEKDRWVDYIDEREQQAAEAQQAEAQAVQAEAQGKLQNQAMDIQGKQQLGMGKLQVEAGKIQSTEQIAMARLAQAEKDKDADIAIAMARLEIDDQKLVLEMIERLSEDDQKIEAQQIRK